MSLGCPLPAWVSPQHRGRWLNEPWFCPLHTDLILLIECVVFQSMTASFMVQIFVENLLLQDTVLSALKNYFDPYINTLCRKYCYPILSMRKLRHREAQWCSSHPTEVEPYEPRMLMCGSIHALNHLAMLVLLSVCSSPSLSASFPSFYLSFFPFPVLVRFVEA